MNPERCYACNKPLTRPEEVYTSDRQMVWVGPECFRKIEAAAETGHQPPLGGPRLFLFRPAEPTTNGVETPREVKP
jgi:hypothetical protein